MVKVLGIGGSPRIGGNTDTLLDGVLGGAGELGAAVEKIILNELNFRPCQECGGCDKTGICVIDDDMNIVYNKIADADHVVIATPLFFRSVSAQLKMMIDRFHCRWIAANVLNKEPSRKGRKGVFICASADTKVNACDGARSLVGIFFNTIGIDLSGEIVCRGADAADDIKRREGSLKKAYETGRAMASAGQC